MGGQARWHSFPRFGSDRARSGTCSGSLDRVSRRRKPSKKIRAGNGSALKPYRWWECLWRSTFSIALKDGDHEDDQLHEYTVDVDYFDWDIRLYTDGVQTAVGSYPVRFPVPGGLIHADLSLYGAQRMHYEPGVGDPVLLKPHRNSLEGLRAAFARQHPLASRIVSWTAIAILLIGLAVFIPLLIQRISEIEWVAEHVGTFVSPIDLPGWLNGTLLVAGILAALERALTIRSNWLIDADTWWLD